MKDFGGKIAVVTGGGTGMGRALVRQLAALGCDVATCDIMDETLKETRRLCEAQAPQGVRIATFNCDVANEDEVQAFQRYIKETFDTDHINLLFNNAGIGGGGSFVESSREEWERTFNICWNGVYYFARVFLPMLLASKEGHIINTSSVNGFRASLGGNIPHTAYSAAKFAVKGFTEALINDFRFNAPHLKASVVMPGYVGTEIAVNTGKILGHSEDLTDTEIDAMRERWRKMGVEQKPQTNDEVRAMVKTQREGYRDGGLTPDQAATVILDGVRNDEWRILVGPDAVALDEAVRAAPLDAYDLEFSDKVWAGMSDD
jgi:NAD(P)-dependent dehydrogenase (short-subunit alcohol dehydrogenase family)